MTEKPITDKQASFLRRLAQERDVMGGQPAELALAALENALPTLTVSAASAMIERSLKAPLRDEAKASTRMTYGDVQPGYYFLKAENEFIVVVMNKAGTRRYAKRLLVTEHNGRKKASWEYAPGLVLSAGGLEPMTLEQAAEFGHLHGVCFKCCKPLTDPESVKRGMGPVCAKALV